MTREKRNHGNRRGPIDPLSRARPADSAVAPLEEIPTAKRPEPGLSRNGDSRSEGPLGPGDRLAESARDIPWYPDADLFQEEPTADGRALADEPTVRDADLTVPRRAIPAEKSRAPRSADQGAAGGTPLAPANSDIDVHVPVAPVQERQRPTQETVAATHASPPGDTSAETAAVARQARRRRMATASYRGVAAKPGGQEAERDRKPLIRASVLIILALGLIVALLSFR